MEGALGLLLLGCNVGICDICENSFWRIVLLRLIVRDGFLSVALEKLL